MNVIFFIKKVNAKKFSLNQLEEKSYINKIIYYSIFIASGLCLFKGQLLSS